MSYSCPDCKDGTLEAQFREIDADLNDGESLEIIDGRVYASSVRCDNGCSDEPEKPKRKKKAAPPVAAGELCAKTEDCDRPNGHTGRCNHNGKPEA